jgi:hypothetical protein
VSKSALIVTLPGLALHVNVHRAVHRAAFHNAMEWTDVGDDLIGITIALMLSVLRR